MQPTVAVENRLPLPFALLFASCPLLLLPPDSSFASPLVSLPLALRPSLLLPWPLITQSPQSLLVPLRICLLLPRFSPFASRLASFPPPSRCFASSFSLRLFLSPLLFCLSSRRSLLFSPSLPFTCPLASPPVLLCPRYLATFVSPVPTNRRLRLKLRLYPALCDAKRVPHTCSCRVSNSTLVPSRLASALRGIVPLIMARIRVVSCCTTHCASPS